MKDFNETNLVNKAMLDILTNADKVGEIEGYSVTSDDLQCPHTIVEIYFTHIDQKGYLLVGEKIHKTFFDYAPEKYEINDFLIPAAHGVHERMRLILSISLKEGV